MGICVDFGLGLLYKASKGILIHDFGILWMRLYGYVPRIGIAGSVNRFFFIVVFSVH